MIKIFKNIFYFRFYFHRKKCLKKVESKKALFYPESRISNFQNDRSKISLGSEVHIRGELLIFASGGEIIIGNNVYIGEHSRIWSAEKVQIGNNVLISHGVNIIDSNSHEINHLKRAEGFLKLVNEGHQKDGGEIETDQIIIEDYAWINFNVIILKGINIGEGAIVAAGSVVTKDVEPFTVVAGNPARVIKKLK